MEKFFSWVLAWGGATKRQWLELEPGVGADMLNEAPCLLDGAPILRSSALLDWLTHHRYAPSLTIPGLTALLKQAGWERKKTRLGAGARDTFWLWAGPLSLLDEDT